MLADDEQGVRTYVKAVLQKAGFHVIEAEDGTEALEFIQRVAGAIDLLLTDVVMPGMNGPALAQRLVTKRPELRVLFISGYADVASLDTGNPNIRFLSKPFQASALAAKVREVLTKGRSGV